MKEQVRPVDRSTCVSTCTVRVTKKWTKVGYGRVAVGYEKVAKGTEG